MVREGGREWPARAAPPGTEYGRERARGRESVWGPLIHQAWGASGEQTEYFPRKIFLYGRIEGLMLALETPKSCPPKPQRPVGQ